MFLQKTILLVLIGLLVGSEAEAAIFQYKPPKNRIKREQKTDTHGSRGCSYSSASLKIIAPKDHIAQSSSSHPTFLFYLQSDRAELLRFSLVSLNNNRLIVDHQFVASPGWVTFTVPDGSIGLFQDLNQLTFGIICNPHKLSESAYGRIIVEKVFLSSNLKKRLQHMERENQLKYLAHQGLWYDVIALKYLEYRLLPQSSQLFEDWLEQVDFATHSYNQL